MRKWSLLLAGSIGLGLLCSSAVLAQGLPNNQAWNQFLAKHPKTRAELQAKPTLMYNPGWLDKHPEFRYWAKTHGRDWAALKAERGSYSPRSYGSPSYSPGSYGPGGDGDYDEGHQWHDHGWWESNRPDWVRDHHPEWYGHRGDGDRDARDSGNGDWDEHHVWHERDAHHEAVAARHEQHDEEKEWKHEHHHDHD